MRQLAVGFLGSVSILGAIAWSAASHEQSQQYFTVRAGPVPNARISALSGTFQMLKAGPGKGIPSSGVGGACLVFSAADLPDLSDIAAKKCSANHECQSEHASAGYCDGKAHSCWMRPKSDVSGSATCNRPIAMTAAVLNRVPAAHPANVGLLGVKPGARVRVVACLNKGAPPFPNKKAPCALIDSADRVEVMGPVATVHP